MAKFNIVESSMYDEYVGDETKREYFVKLINLFEKTSDRFKQNGKYFVHVWNDREGNRFASFSSKPVVEVGDCAVIKAYIKVKEDYKGVESYRFGSRIKLIKNIGKPVEKDDPPTQNSAPIDYQNVVGMLYKTPHKISYTTVSGQKRSIIGTTNLNRVPLNMHPSSNKKINYDIINVFDLEIGKWRSIRLENINNITPL